jgi:double-strand break repair protein MRE11
VAHSPNNYVHEEFLESWLDMVIWGHEHECIIQPTASAVGSFFISQPGSSVATALSEGEAVPKYARVYMRCSRVTCAISGSADC